MAVALVTEKTSCRLTICWRSQDKLQAQVEALRVQVPEVAVLITPMDGRDEALVQVAVQQAQARFSPINILVNTASQFLKSIFL